MPELRQDAVTREWVIFAPERRSRPLVTHAAEGVTWSAPRELPAHDPACDFCPGNEEATPPESQAYRLNGSAPDSPGWSVRAFPNKFPALVTPEDADAAKVPRTAHHDVEIEPSPLGLLAGAEGGHEVIIESPRHNAGFGWNLTDDEAADAVRMYWARYRHWAAQPGIAHIVIFKNHGAAAGATQPHPHAQFMAMPVVSERIRRLAEQAARPDLPTVNGCPFCHIIQHEQDEGDRVIEAADGFLAWMPWAGQYPYEIWIAPLEHQAIFGRMGEEQAAALGRLINRLVARLNAALNQPAYNLVLVDGAQGEPDARHFHWHLRLIPKLTQYGGLEIGSGTFINLVLPEEAAGTLRNASPRP